MIEIKPNQAIDSSQPSNKKFGMLFSGVFLLLTLVIWVAENNFVGWLLFISVIFLMSSIFFPNILSPLNRLWMKFGDLLHHIVSPLILGVMFYGVITPIGRLMRIFGKRPLDLELNHESVSYWIKQPASVPPSESMHNQF